ncbi:MAG: hypothetical protein SAqBPW_10770 [Shewanella algae]
MPVKVQENNQGWQPLSPEQAKGKDKLSTPHLKPSLTQATLTAVQLVTQTKVLPATN